MITVEIKVNGALVGILHARNLQIRNDKDEVKYLVQLWKPELNPVGRIIWHRREDGAEVLVMRALQAIKKRVDKSGLKCYNDALKDG